MDLLFECESFGHGKASWTRGRFVFDRRREELVNLELQSIRNSVQLMKEHVLPAGLDISERTSRDAQAACERGLRVLERTSPSAD